MALMREINDLHQWVGAGEGQPAESLDHIEHELQNPLIALHPPPPPYTNQTFWRSDTPVYEHLVPHRNKQTSPTHYYRT